MTTRTRYARVSKPDGSQVHDLRCDALIAAGVDPDHIHEDAASGWRKMCPGLESMIRSSLIPLLYSSSLLVAGCATSALPASCIGLRGVRAVPVEQADGSVTIRYIYADEAVRLPHLQCRADQGERVAMVELARALETGHGVVRDDVRAAALYEKAAQDRPAFTSIYAPPVQRGGSGRVMMIPNADGGAGNAEAKYRLGQMLVEGRGTGQDVARGRKLMGAARSQGFEP